MPQPRKAASKSEQQKSDDPEIIEGTASNSNGNKGDDAAKEMQEALEILEPMTDPREWIVGKPPEKGGTDDEYERFIQRPLGYMSRMRFFALVSRTIADSMKAGAMLELPGEGGIRQRVAAIRDSDLTDSGSLIQLVFQLGSYSEDFLLDAYCIMLDVPTRLKPWARLVMDQPYDPERNMWGLRDEDGMDIIATFIDQNYDTLREFFTGKVPALYKRVQQREAKYAKENPDSTGRESELALSKP